MFASLAGIACAGALEVAVADLPAGLDPWAPPGTLEARLGTLIYDRLVSLDPVTREPVGRVLDARVEGDAWVLTLHRVRWHDGRPATADDVCFSVAAALDPRAPPWWSGPTAASIDRCDVIDGRRARITPAAGVADPRAGLAIPFVPRHGYPAGNPWFAPEIGRTPLGTGRYRASRTGSGWTLRRTAANRSAIRAIHLKSATDADAAVEMLLAADVDGVLAVPPTRVPAVVAADGIALRWTARRQMVAIALDPGDGPTADAGVRRALDLLLDREALRDRVVGVDPSDDRQPATLISGPFFPGTPSFTRTIPPTPHDATAATEALTQAGYAWSAARWVRGEEPLRIRVGSPPAPIGDPALLEAVGSQWRRAGVEVEAVVLSASSYARALAGEPLALDALLVPWFPPEDGSPAGLVASNGWSNPFRFSDPAVDQALSHLADADPDVAKWAAWSLHGRLADRSPFLFLWTSDAWSAWSDEAVTFTPMTPGDVFGAIEDWR